MPYVTGLESRYPEVYLKQENDDLYAVLTYRLNFDEDEERLNLGYSIYAALYEIDDSLDKYISWPNGRGRFQLLRAVNKPTDMKHKDDFVGWFPTENAKPEDGKKQDFEVRLKLSDEVQRYFGGAKYEIAENSEVLESVDVAEDERGSDTLNSLRFRAIVDAHPSLSATTFSNEMRSELGQIIT